jgi:polysaccharide deacetylase family protein (PEP-CTERM system associated)
LRLVHALSVDVEDWFQVLNMQHLIQRGAWDGFALRCGDATKRILDVLARRSARATFFCLGWIAERLPDLVREVVEAGHEVGSHGYDHRTLDELGPDGFRADLERTERILAPLTGARPTSFRACTWSIGARTPWAPAVLCERGYTIDSSIFPIRHPDYGVPGAPPRPYRLIAGPGSLIEVPPLTMTVLGKVLPVGGGGYLRLLPLALLERGLRQQEAQGWPGCVYLHPWEVDPEQPRQALRGVRRFRHYVNLRATLPKLDALLSRHAFAGLGAAMAAVADRPLEVVDAAELLSRQR